jgi:hypothetical protein
MGYHVLDSYEMPYMIMETYVNPKVDILVWDQACYAFTVVLELV